VDFVDSFYSAPVLVRRSLWLGVWIISKTTEATKKQLSFYQLFR